MPQLQALHARRLSGSGFVERALAFFAAHGIAPKRLLSDNAFTYTKNRTLAELLRRHGIRHLRTDPWRPQTNGKVERYQQTLKREWALGQRYRSSQHRAQALPHWLRHYNEATAPLSDRQPPTHQPRSERPRARHLGRRGDTRGRRAAGRAVAVPERARG